MRPSLLCAAVFLAALPLAGQAPEAEGQRFSLAFRDLPLKQAVELVARMFGVTVELTGTDGGRRVTLGLGNVTLEQALRELRQPEGLEVRRLPGAARYLVLPPGQQVPSADGGVWRSLPLRHLRPTELVAWLRPATPSPTTVSLATGDLLPSELARRLSVEGDPNPLPAGIDTLVAVDLTGELLVTGTPAAVAELELRIRALAALPELEWRVLLAPPEPAWAAYERPGAGVVPPGALLSSDGPGALRLLAQALGERCGQSDWVRGPGEVELAVPIPGGTPGAIDQVRVQLAARRIGSGGRLAVSLQATATDGLATVVTHWQTIAMAPEMLLHGVVTVPAGSREPARWLLFAAARQVWPAPPSAAPSAPPESSPSEPPRARPVRRR